MNTGGELVAMPSMKTVGWEGGPEGRGTLQSWVLCVCVCVSTLRGIRGFQPHTAADPNVCFNTEVGLQMNARQGSSRVRVQH